MRKIKLSRQFIILAFFLVSIPSIIIGLMSYQIFEAEAYNNIEEELNAIATVC